jgi:hypothetical protein
VAQVISKVELAAYLSVVPSRVTALCKRGLPVRTDGKINLPEAVKWMKANCQQTAVYPDRGINKIVTDSEGPEPVEATTALDDDNAVLPFADAKALRETYLARMARLAYRERAGELLEAEAVERKWANGYRAGAHACRAVAVRVEASAPLAA